MEIQTEDSNVKKQSRLIDSLREGVAVVQMIFFKQLRIQLAERHSTFDQKQLSMLAGSIINEVFGTPNSEPHFMAFRKEQWSVIEQELLRLEDLVPQLISPLTDAIRVQTLCDSQEGVDSSDVLLRGKQYSYLVEEREIPLPSTFMTQIRLLGEQHNLLIPPVQITPEQDQELIH